MFMASSSPQAHVDIDHVANLARLALTPDEKARFAKQFDDILGYFDRLNRVDVTGVDPTAHALPRVNIWREDMPGATFTPEEAVANAPAAREAQVVVPRVIE